MHQSPTTGVKACRKKNSNQYVKRHCIVFHMQIRQTQNVSVFKVAFSSRLKFEGPKCVNGRAVSWHTSWLPERYALHYAVSLQDHVCMFHTKDLDMRLYHAHMSIPNAMFILSLQYLSLRESWYQMGGLVHMHAKCVQHSCR